MDDFRFAPLRLRSLLEQYVAGYATLAFDTDSHRSWVVPHNSGSPITLRLEDGECVIQAGFSFRMTISAGEAGSEWMVFDCIEAIISGQAYEVYDFASDHLGMDRSAGVAGAGFAGKDMAIETDRPVGSLTRGIPAWESIPPRPVATTMQTLWGDA